MALLVEMLVAGLLAVTIGYCVILNRRLQAMRSDETTLRKTVDDLTAATETATLAVAGLKRTVADEEAALSDRLGEARTVAYALDQAVTEGADVIRKLRMIIEAGRPTAAPEVRAPRRAPAPPEPANEIAFDEEADHRRAGGQAA